MKSQLCPCGTKKRYLDCCALFIEQHNHPETAQQLMRSRYSANVRQELNYLLSSWHHTTRPNDMNLSDLKTTNWLQLYIVECTEGLKQHNNGSVEFVAYFLTNGSTEKLHEKSQFIKQHNQWLYVDGKIIEHSNYQPGRNLPCYCGSGKKFKHCCHNK